MTSEHFLFVGFEVDESTQARLDNCHERLRIYLEDSVHLERVSIDGKLHIGKRVENGTATDRIEDTARSVVSLLSRIDEEWPQKASQALVVPLSGSNKDAGAVISDGSEQENFDYAGLISSD